MRVEGATLKVSSSSAITAEALPRSQVELVSDQYASALTSGGGGSNSREAGATATTTMEGRGFGVIPVMLPQVPSRIECAHACIILCPADPRHAFCLEQAESPIATDTTLRSACFVFAAELLLSWAILRSDAVCGQGSPSDTSTQEEEEEEEGNRSPSSSDGDSSGVSTHCTLPQLQGF